MTTQTIGQEREALNEKRAALMQQRGEVAKSLRNEHIDGEGRRELKEKQAELTADIRAVENDLATLDDAEQSAVEERKAAGRAEKSRRRQEAADKAHSAGREVYRWATVVEEVIVSLVRAINNQRAAEAEFRQCGPPAVDSGQRDEFRMACNPLLDIREIALLLEDVPKGVFRTDLAFTAKVGTRVNRALVYVPGAEQ